MSIGMTVIKANQYTVLLKLSKDGSTVLLV